MKTLSTVFFLAIFFLTAPIAGATPSAGRIDNDYYLKKLSQHLRGMDPSYSEYQSLDALNTPDQIQQFFKDKIDQYLGSDAHRDHMIFLLSEKFQIKTPSVDTSYIDSFKNDEDKRTYQWHYTLDSMTDIFDRMAEYNLPWDYLLTGKDYNLYDRTDPNVESSNPLYDFNFFRPLFPNLPEVTDNVNPLQRPKSVHIEFSANDPRVAGVLTTPRFLSRYNTTNLNKNRRRAAAVFRIFLCDPMVPVIPPPPDRKNAELKFAFGNKKMEKIHQGATEEQLSDAFTLSDSQRHGSDPKCAACHYKLDPMGRTFENIGIGLNPEPAPGILTFKRSDGELVKQYVSGIGGLGSNITKLPEYVSCQIHWFWNEFIGQNVVLTSQRKTELTAAFNSMGRRTNDFIRYLVTSPEFRTRPTTPARITFDRVKPLLDRCDSCHIGEGYFSFFTSGNIDKKTLAKMRWRLNLPDGNKDKMPRDWSHWKQEDLNLVKTWINQGALGPDGKPEGQGS